MEDTNRVHLGQHSIGESFQRLPPQTHGCRLSIHNPENPTPLSTKTMDLAQQSEVLEIGSADDHRTASFSPPPFPSPIYTFGVQWPELNDGISYTDVVKETTALIQFYSTKYRSSAPLHGWIQRIQNGQITVDDQLVFDQDHTIRTGSKLVYKRLPWREPDTPYLLEVLYEDEHMISLNKPSGLQVLPGGLFQQRTVLRQLELQACKSNSDAANGKCHPVPVHRLGRGTSGILLCAKTKIAKTCLAGYFADGTSSVTRRRTSQVENTSRTILKSYRALVKGILNKDEVIVEQPIGMVHYPSVAKGLFVASLSGKPALSKIHVLERYRNKNQTLIQVEIYSGRPHQIRIHVAFIGHPLVGDPLYVSGGYPRCAESLTDVDAFAEDGGYHRPVNPVPGDCGYYLHAHRLILKHPVENKVIEITAPLPTILQTSEESCKNREIGSPVS